MLDYSPINLLQELENAVAHRDKYIKTNKQDLLQILVGSYYRTDMRPMKESPENYPFSFIANIAPKICFDNPRVSCKSANVAVDSDKTTNLGRAINQWIKTVDLVSVLDPYAVDALLMWSVVVTTFEVHDDDIALPDNEMKRMIPRCHLLENHRYFRDPTSTPATKPRYEGHIWVRDMADVAKMQGVDPAAIDQLTADFNLELLKRPNSSKGGHSDMPSRQEVVAYECWVPEINTYRPAGKDAKLYNGTIFTIAVGQTIGAAGAKKVGSAKYLKEPRAYFGPPWGPYSMCGFYDVPEQTYPLSPIAVVMQQVEELNAHCTAVANAASRMKNLVFVDAAMDTLQSAVQNSPDGSCIGISGLTADQVIPVVIGGPAKEQYEYIQILRERLDRNIGIDDAQRGELNPQVTATATNVAYQSTAVRVDHLKRRYTQAVKKILNTAGWYAWHSNNFVMFLAPDDAEELEMKKPAFLGGPQQGEEEMPYDQTAMDIEPYSLIKVDESVLAQEMLETLALVVQMAQEMTTAPWLRWDIINRELGQVRKFDWLNEVINSDLFIQYQQQMQSQNEQNHSAEMAMRQLQMEGLHADNILKKLEAMRMMKEMQMMGQEEGGEKDGISKSLSYKDTPEDIKRQMEQEAGYKPSTQPLTAQAHVQNAMTIHGNNAQAKNEVAGQQADHKHQETQQRTSKLAGMLTSMAKGGGAKAGGRNATAGQRAQQGPMETASKAAKAKR